MTVSKGFRNPMIAKAFEEVAQLGTAKPDVANVLQTMLVILCELDARYPGQADEQDQKDS